MRYVSLFSGIEAASVAWQSLGWEPVAFSEIDKFPSAVLAHRFHEIPNLGDITKIDWTGYAGSIDLVVGGSPCQSFSIAGKREGLAGASGLMYEYIRAVSEIRPRYFVWENVPGALSSEKGEAFRQLLTEMDVLGYGMAWRVLDAQFFGVPQRRRRVFLVGCLGEPERAAEILFERESLCWDYPSSRVKRQELAAAAGRGAALGGECLTPWDVQSRRIYETEIAAPTLSAQDRDGGHNSVNVLAFDTTQITSPSNGNNPQFGDPCHPLCANAHVPTVAFSAGQSSQAGSLGLAEEIAPTLRGGSSGTNQVPTICIDGDIARGAYMGKNGKGWNTDGVTSTITTIDVPAVLTQNIVCMASGQANAEIAYDCCTSQAARQHKDPPIVTNGYVVRRLTPLECERLQGFPDGWTQIPYKGKAAADCPDTPRYKALGNSMAVPVMAWIGKRIAAVDAAWKEANHG